MATEARVTSELAEHVLVLASSGGDARALGRALAPAGLASRSFAAAELIARLDEGDAGAVLLAEDGLTAEAVTGLVVALENQPLWSDLAVVLLAGDGQPADSPAAAELRAACHLTRLERPSPATLSATLTAALRARRRQYQVRDRMEQQVTALRQADHDRALRDEFLSWVSHELQTPVSAILLWLRLIAAGTVRPQDLPRALASIESSARTQSYLVNDLLDASRLAAGTLRPSLRPEPLGPVVEAAVEVARSLADGRQVSLAVSLAPDVPPAPVDAERLRRVVWNLLVSAITTTSPGGEVRVALSGDGAGARITVRGPDGAPRPAEPPPRRGDLGLRLCQRLVELHGGALEAAGPGDAAAFVVRLPVAAGV